MKEHQKSIYVKRRKKRKTFLVFKVLILLLLCMPRAIYGQLERTKVNISLSNASLQDAIWDIEKQTKFVFIYNVADLNTSQKVNVKIKDKTAVEALDLILKDSGLEYIIKNDTVVIRKKAQTKLTQITGRIVDNKGAPLPGVSVSIKGIGIGEIADVNGDYSITIPAGTNPVLIFSFIGMKKKEVDASNKTIINVAMEEDETMMSEVVVTGIYSRRKDSFTGSSQTYKAEELKAIGNQNLIQSLKTLDPAFTVFENNQFGSDPNRLPDMEIRGKTSIIGFKEEFGEDPNQPLFILDGFETTPQTVMDLSMDRIESVTILKDAASTAIYGAKAANGVIVVETKTPKSGKVQLSYNGSLDISTPDLSVYNLMNAEEKLEFELLSGNFDSNMAASREEGMARYNRLRSNVLKGVDSYWLSEPVRTGITQRHNLFVQGGDQQMRYGATVSYSDIKGVMKKSERQMFSGNLNLLYRTGKLSFNNSLTIDYTRTSDPVVAFSEYAKTNPYYPKTSETRGIEKWLETPYTPGEEVKIQSNDIWISNPLWNDALDSFNRGNTTSIRNNFNIEYSPFDFMRLRGRLGINKSSTNKEEFRAPEDTSFDGMSYTKKGTYNDNRTEMFSYEGDLTATYGQLLAEHHQINAVLGAYIYESENISKGFSAEGFPEGGFTSPSFANSYKDGAKPRYTDSKKRSVSFYFNGGYSLMNKYLLDANLRSDGASVFGVNKKFTTTWSVGLGWNLHNESFVKNNTNLFSMLKIRASIGNPGNQSFGSFNTITTYKFNNWLINNFGTGLLVDVFGDPDLEWQKTLDKNIGFDLSMYNSRFHINFDVYHKATDPLMAKISTPLSVGVSSRMMNVGNQIEKGMYGRIQYAFIYQPKNRINWTTSVTFRHGKAYYDGVEAQLGKRNLENQTKNLQRYFDKGSPTSLWAVRSEGIDPATGQEIFLTKSGNRTFAHSYSDEVKVGDSRPKIEGVIGNTLYYKGLSLGIHLRYSWGADAFNNTLYNKVENISYAAIKQNQDKRALYDRWKQPGDKAEFKGISLNESTPMSSRFVQKNNYITIESVNIAYEFEHKAISKLGLSGVTLRGYMNDIHRFSTIKDEKGIEYPFARSVSFAVSINF